MYVYVLCDVIIYYLLYILINSVLSDVLIVPKCTRFVPSNILDLEIKNTTMRNFLYIIIFLWSSFSFGQDLKTYKGKFASDYSPEGAATYTYYEDKETLEFVKHGNFTYHLKLKSPEKGQIEIEISGKFNHGKRNGSWKYTRKRVDFKNESKKNSYATGESVLIANYKDGYPNGEWNYTLKNRNRQRIYTLVGYTWSDYSKEFIRSAHLNFNKGTLTSNLKLNNNNSRTIEGQFNEDGFMIGKWVWQNGTSQTIKTFEKGVLMTQISRDIATGNINKKDFEFQDIRKKFVDGKLTVDDIKSQRIFIDTLEAGLSFNQTEIVNDALFYKYIDGDLTYFYKEFNYEPNYENLRNEGHYIKVQIIEYANLKEDLTFKQAEKEFKAAHYQKALASYTRIIERNDRYKNNRNYDPKAIRKEMISPKDMKFLEKRLRVTDSLEKVEKEIYRMKSEMKRLMAMTSTVDYKMEKIKSKDLSYFEGKIRDYERKLNEYKGIIIQDYEKLLHILIDKNKTAVKKKKELIQKEENYKVIELKNLKIHDLCDVQVKGNSLKPKDHKNIFESYNSIYQQGHSNGNLKNDIGYQQEIMEIQKNIIMITGNEDKAKDVDKQVRKADSQEQKKSILLNYSK